MCPGDSHFRLLEGAGGTGLNGTTDFDRTNYFETVPANQLEFALWLESDRMGYLLEVLDQAKLSNQQDVVRNERRQGRENAPYGMVYEAMVKALYPAGHPYHGVVIGSHADIQAARLEDVRQFFRQYYAPNNATLAIAGDIDKPTTKKLIEKYFGSLRRGPAVPPVNVKTPPITSERRIVVQDRVELPRVYMAWHSPAYFKDGDADADIAAGVLGDGRSSRLYKKLVYERQIAQSVNAYQNSAMLSSAFGIEATARPGHTLQELETAIDEELATLLQGRTDAGRSRARAQRDRDTDAQRPAATRRIWWRRGSIESVQPLRWHAGLSGAGHHAAAPRDTGLGPTLRAAVSAAGCPRHRARRAGQTGSRT